jgi:hypothetical protein
MPFLAEEPNDLADKGRGFRRAVALQPDLPTAHQNLGLRFASWVEPHEALRHFERVQRGQPQAMNLVLGATVLPTLYGCGKRGQCGERGQESFAGTAVRVRRTNARDPFSHPAVRVVQ